MVELAEKFEEKVFRDPVHNFIYITDKIILDLINTREMQRLRRIGQLGTSYLTYHGAEHTRFTHSLGTYEVMRKILSSFKRNDYLDLSGEERLLCLCAALLHDIGHGPFSHAIEKIVHKDHEKWTQEIIEGDTEVNRILRTISENFPKIVSEVIGKKYSNKLIVSLISSQLDADRMDYLLRDCTTSGVSYGQFDLERMVRVLYPYNGSIVIKESGIHCAEQYILARYYMYWQVYFHPTTRSAEVVLKKIFKRAEYLHKNNRLVDIPEVIEKLFKNCMSLNDYVELDEPLILYCFKQWCKSNDKILADLCDRVINRRLFKCIDCKDYFVNNPMLPIEIANLFKQIFADKYNAEEDREYFFDIDVPKNVSYDYYRPGEKEEKFPINVLIGNEIEEISRNSTPVKSLTGEEQHKHRLYFAQDLIDENNHKLIEIKKKLGVR